MLPKATTRRVNNEAGTANRQAGFVTKWGRMFLICAARKPMYKSMKKTVYEVALDIGFYEGQ